MRFSVDTPIDLLNAHPDIVIWPETHFVRLFWERREAYGDLSSDEGWGRLVRDVAAMPELGDIGIAQERVIAAAAGLERHPARLLRLLLDLFAGDAAVAPAAAIGSPGRLRIDRSNLRQDPFLGVDTDRLPGPGLQGVEAEDRNGAEGRQIAGAGATHLAEVLSPCVVAARITTIAAGVLAPQYIVRRVDSPVVIVVAW